MSPAGSVVHLYSEETMHVVVKPFPFSENGVKVEILAAGQKRSFGSLTQGLLDAGYIALEGAKLPAGSVPAMPGRGTADTEPLVLPEGWRELHHNILIPLAQKIEAGVAKKAEAIAVLEKFEKDAAAQQAAVAGASGADASGGQS